MDDALFSDASTKLAKLAQRIHDAETFQVPRLRDHTGAVALQQRYATELREDIESFRRELETIETFTDDIVRPQDRTQIWATLDELTPRVEQLKKDARGALLASKQAIDSQARSHRDELLQTSAVNSQLNGKPKDATDDVVMSANDAVTDALRRTTQLMQQELERSVLATQMLEESTQTLSMTSQVYTTFTSLLDTSKTLIVALEKSDWLDRMLILSSLGLFFLSAAYIFKKRIIDRGVWLAFWWVKYIPFPSLSSSPSSSASNIAHQAADVTIYEVLEPLTSTVLAEAAALSTSVSLAVSTAVSALTASPSSPSSPSFTSEYTSIVDDLLATPMSLVSSEASPVPPPSGGELGKEAPIIVEEGGIPPVAESGEAVQEANAEIHLPNDERGGSVLPPRDEL